MYVGLSKNIGNGFRVGIGTRINTKPSNKKLKNDDFMNFLAKVQDKLNYLLLTFIEANGYKYDELVKYQVDLDDIFSESKEYKDFISLLSNSKSTIDKILFSGDDGVVAKRTITEEVFKIEEFLNSTYPNFQPKGTLKDIERANSPIKTTFYKVLLGVLIFIAPFIFAWFTLKDGYSKRYRIIAFSWLILFFLLPQIFNKQEPNNISNGTAVQKETK